MYAYLCEGDDQVGRLASELVLKITENLTRNNSCYFHSMYCFMHTLTDFRRFVCPISLVAELFCGWLKHCQSLSFPLTRLFTLKVFKALLQCACDTLNDNNCDC